MGLVQEKKPTAQSFILSTSTKPRGLPPLPRTVHGPQRNLKFFGSVNSVKKSQAAIGMGSLQSRVDDWIRRKATRVEGSNSMRKTGVDVNVIDVDSDQSQSSDMRIEGLRIEEYKRLVEGLDDNSVVSDWASRNVHLQESKVVNSPLGSSSSAAVSDLSVLTQKTNVVGKMVDVVLVNDAVERRSPAYKRLQESSKRWDLKSSSLDLEIRLAEEKISTFKLKDQAEDVDEDVAYEPFVPLTDVEEDCVSDALFGSNRQEVLVVHDSLNIEITREVLQCLRPGGWLNDEVINLYLELLKEREKRSPQKFLKCHFFNTFFYKKLINERKDYDYKAVRRWTAQKKIGYSLIDCDKIFVPIHKDIHWCLAVVNIKDEKFQYLDSLGGMDSQALKVLARYFADEVKDKSDRAVNLSSWKQEFVDGLPQQRCGWDCGMFMIKYADFYSRGLTLCFNQEHMPYFRKRTAKEILRLRAE
ncbi:hypothetical protein AAC387_Pa09g0359 [Persea americana]